jgi:nucleotide-binding universal stress UspA family protein
MFKKILIAYDGSPFAKRAFEVGLETARLHKAEVAVLSIVQIPEPAMIYESSALLDEAQENYAKDFTNLNVAAKSAGVALHTSIVVGHVADQIVQHATNETADLIVMGHRGKSLIERWLLGSVSKRVVSYAHCSVLIVR